MFWFYKYFIIAGIIFSSFAAFAQDQDEQDNDANQRPFIYQKLPPANSAPAPEEEKILPKDFFETPENVRKSNPENFTAKVILRALNKITAHTSTLEIAKGSEVSFGTLDIKMEQCWRSSPGDMPEAAALLRITEQKAGEKPAQIFFGWMFASSPGINALEHAVYDISVVSCID